MDLHKIRVFIFENVVKNVYLHFQVFPESQN